MSRRTRLLVNLAFALGGWLAAQGVVHVVCCGMNLRCLEAK